LVYAAAAMSAIVGIGSLAVDLGRLQTAKSQLQTVTDAAARYAAYGMQSSSAGTSAAYANAAAVFADNQVEGKSVEFVATRDVELGIWDEQLRKFTPTSLSGGANAVRLRSKASLNQSAGALSFLSMLGRSVEVNSESVVTMNGKSATTFAGAKGNPWLAGMPAGSVSRNNVTNTNDWDYAGSGPNQSSSPGMIDLSAAKLDAGKTIMFDQVSGGANNGASSTVFNPDGNLGWIVNLGGWTGTNVSSRGQPVNGISNVVAPINSMMGVFLSDSRPDSSSAPDPLDFSSAESRNFISLSPKLKQVFFVGDGRRANGEAQRVVIPTGATRLYIANMDAWEWSNNIGGYTVAINNTQGLKTVK